MRTFISAGVVSSALAATLLLAPVAYATAPVPGDNGTVKIHDAVTGEEPVDNEPHVCTFYLDAFGFDSVQQVDWKIEDWPPTGSGQVVKNGAITLDHNGHGRTVDLALSDGHYKLLWTFEGEKGAAKQKVFWVDCPSKSPSPSETPSESTKPSTSPSPSASSSASPSPSGSKTPISTATPVPSSSTTAVAGTALAETGTPAAALAAIAAALVGVGGALTLRRRAGRRH